MRVVLSLLLLAAVAVSAGTWTDICKKSGNCLSLMMGVSCESASMCAIVGGQSNTPMGVYYSKDQFDTFTLADMKDDSLMLMDIALDTKGAGATAGMGALNHSGLLYTTDVTTWGDSTDVTFLVGQDMNAFGNGEFGFVGTTNNLANTEGVLVSSNGGKVWTAANWPNDLSNATTARYGSFPSDQVLYVSGGNWPSNNGRYAAMEEDCLALSSKTCVKVGPKQKEQVAFARSRLAHKSEVDGYYAVLTKSTDGGKTWVKQFESKGQFYFNDINCIDTTHCFAVAEGFTDGSAPGARIFQTTDGTTWKQVFENTAAHASLMRVHMVSRMEAWAAGGDESKGAAYGTFFHTVDGGKTWTDESPVKFVGDVTGLHFVDSKLGFAVGVTEFQTSVMIKYTN